MRYRSVSTSNYTSAIVIDELYIFPDYRCRGFAWKIMRTLLFNLTNQLKGQDTPLYQFTEICLRVVPQSWIASRLSCLGFEIRDIVPYYSIDLTDSSIAHSKEFGNLHRTLQSSVCFTLSFEPDNAINVLMSIISFIENQLHRKPAYSYRT